MNGYGDLKLMPHKKLIQSILLIIISLLISELSFPQNYLITKYSTDNGLPDNRVNDIAQDSLGRIWIAMVSGIAMYDGYEWTKFGEKEGVPEIEYIRVKVDERGVVWFLPKSILNNSLVYIKNEKCYKFNLKSSSNNSAVYSNDFEILYNSNGVEIFVSRTNMGLLRYFNYRWEKIDRSSGLLCDTISQIYNINSQIYVLTFKGINILKGNIIIDSISLNLKNRKEVFLSSSRVNSVSRYNIDSILIMGQTGIGWLIGNKINSIEYNINLPFQGYGGKYFISHYLNDCIIVGNNACLFMINPIMKTHKQIFLENNKSDRGGTSLIIDSEKNIWISSLRGVYKLNFIPFSNYSQLTGLLENEVSAISGFSDGRIIFGHNYGLTICSHKGFRHIKFNSDEEKSTRILRVMNFYHNKINDDLTFPSLQYGIGTLTQKLDLTWQILPEVETYYYVFSFNQNIFISTSKGLNKITAHNNLTFSSNYNELTRCETLGPDGKMYLTSPRGLIEIYNGNKRYFNTPNSESDNMYGLLFSSYYGLLVGSAKGLFRLEDNSLRRFNFNSQTISEPIYFIIQDSSKNIWLGTNNGVLKWDGKYLKRYNKSDGLAGNETNRAAGYVDSKGNVWIGTDEGVSMYTGEEIDYSSYTPKVLLLNFKDHSNRVYLLNENVNVDPDKNNLTFNYRGLSFIDEKRNTFQIKLASLDGDYQNEFSTKSTSARFNNLAPGNYVFSVRIQNAKGVWSEWKNSPIITIQKHFYNQPLFYTGAFILFILFAYWINNFFQQKKYTRKLEEAVKVRTQDLVQMQNELITNVNRYKGIVESQTDLVVRVDNDGRFTFVNDAYCLVFGKKQNELIGYSFAPFIHPDDLERTFAEMEKLKLPPYRVTIEHRALTEAGYRWFSWENYSIRDHSEKIVEIQGVGRDITLQKEIEKELEKRVRERTIELESLVKQSPLGILIFNGEGKLLTFNKTAIEIFKLYEDVYNTFNDYNLFDDELLIKNNFKDKLDFIKTTNSSFSTEPMLVSSPESKIYKQVIDRSLLYRIYAIEFEDNHKNIVLLVDDITEQQNAETSKRKLNEEKIRVSAIIKTIENERTRISKELHDSIGQMLTAVKLKLEIINIKSSDYKLEISDSIELLLNAGDEIRRIINDLNPGDVKKLGLISAVELLLQRIKNYSNINLTFIHDTIGKINSGEKELLIYRIIQESLNNIIKHSNCKNAGVEFSGEINHVLIKIWDDGVGCSEEELKNRDNKFGIANMYERVASLGGKIKIQTNINKGFVILLNIPV